MLRHVSHAAIALMLMFALVSCRNEGGNGDETDTTRTAARVRSPVLGSSPSDADILALLDWANVTDSTAAALAVTKGSGSELRAFARLMLRDHHALRVEGERVARRLRVTPALPQGPWGAARRDSIMTMLNGAARGRDFDKAYADHEVAFHLEVLETATAAMDLARVTEVKALIQRLAPMLRDHLDQAQAIQARLR